MYIQLVNTLSRFGFVLACVLSVVGCDPSGAKRGQQFGSILLSVTHEDGSPYAGLVVRLAGTSLESATDAEGNARFEGLPAGERVSLVYSQPFSVQDRERGVVGSEMLLEDAASVTVPEGEVQLHAQVKAKLQPAGCNTMPWAMMGVTTGSDLAPFIAKGSVGKYGPCSCKASATAPLGVPACPGTTIFAAGAAPAPQAWSVTSDTCLGDAPNCAAPIRSATADVFK